jgi:hypothetical protein
LAGLQQSGLARDDVLPLAFSLTQLNLASKPMRDICGSYCWETGLQTQDLVFGTKKLGGHSYCMQPSPPRARLQPQEPTAKLPEAPEGWATTLENSMGSMVSSLSESFLAGAVELYQLQAQLYSFYLLCPLMIFKLRTREEFYVAEVQW